MPFDSWRWLGGSDRPVRQVQQRLGPLPATSHAAHARQAASNMHAADRCLHPASASGHPPSMSTEFGCSPQPLRQKALGRCGPPSCCR